MAARRILTLSRTSAVREQPMREQHRQEMLADHQIRVGRSHVPRTNRPETHKLLDEVLERDASVPNARAGARTCRRRRVEGVRIARIHQVHQYIA